MEKVSSNRKPYHGEEIYPLQLETAPKNPFFRSVWFQVEPIHHTMNLQPSKHLSVVFPTHFSKWNTLRKWRILEHLRTFLSLESRFNEDIFPLQSERAFFSIRIKFLQFFFFYRNLFRKPFSKTKEPIQEPLVYSAAERAPQNPFFFTSSRFQVEPNYHTMNLQLSRHLGVRCPPPFGFLFGNVSKWNPFRR